MKNLFRFSTEEKISISIKLIVIGIFALGLLTSCGSIDIRYSVFTNATRQQSLNVPRQQITKFDNISQIYSNTIYVNKVIYNKRLEPCRIHGHHDLRNFSDFTYNSNYCGNNRLIIKKTLIWSGENWSNRLWSPYINTNVHNGPWSRRVIQGNTLRIKRSRRTNSYR